MQNIDQLLHSKWLITCEENNRVLENHALAIKDKIIVDILPSKEASTKYHATNTATYPSHAILPGFFNSHTHTPMSIFRGLADDLELMNWLNNYIWPAEKKYLSAELVTDAAQLAMAEMLRCGTICFNDMYFYMEDIAKVADQVGMRAFIGMHVINVPTSFAKTMDDYFAKAQNFYEAYKNHPLIQPTLAPHSTYTVTVDELIKIKELSDRYGLKTNIHLQEVQAEIDYGMKNFGMRPLALLDDIGLLSSNLIAIHMTHLNDQDFELLQKYSPSIVHCPESNMKLISGLCQVQKLLDLGINVALGTDGAASNNDLDMIGEMRSAAFLGKVVTNDPQAVSAETALKMATINGAKALGIDKITGSLSKNKSADFIAIDLSPIETQPIYHPVSQIVYAVSRDQVTDVWIQGRQLLKNRQLLTIDEKEVLSKAQNWRNKIETLI